MDIGINALVHQEQQNHRRIIFNARVFEGL